MVRIHSDALMKKIVKDNVHFMKEALKEARKAFDRHEVPVGAVIVRDGKIISRGYNKKESARKATRHAEIEAIEKACRKLENWRLNDCTIYVTLEPCMMCLGAILEARIKKVIFGADDLRMGFLRYFGEKKPPYAYSVEYESGVLGEDCAGLMRKFFKIRRGG